MKRTPAFNPPVTRKETAVQYLTEQYNSNLEFMREFGVLLQNEKTNLGPMLDKGFWPPFGNIYDGVGRLSSWQPSWELTRKANRLLCEETLEKTEALAYRWGLRAPWAALLVLQLAIGNVRSQPEKPSFIYDFSPLWGEIVKEIDLKPIWDIIGPIPEGTPLTVNGPRDVVLLALNYRPEAESRDDFLKRVRRAARTAMDEIEEDLSHSVGLERAGVRSELRSHVRLLYLAICPDPGLGRPLTNEEIVLREHVENETTVSKAVNSIAGLLDIHTGRRPGRPPKP